MKKQRLLILGSTGSIGKNTLDVASRHPDRIEVFALSANTQVDLMFAQCVQHQPRFAVMVSEPHAQVLAEKVHAHGLSTQVLSGAAALDELASHPAAPTMAAITESTSG